MRHDPGDENLAIGQLHVFEKLPFMLVSGIGSLDRICAGANLQHQVEVIAQLEVVDTRRNVDAVACMKTDTILGNSPQRIVDRLDPCRDELTAFLDAGAGRAVIMRRHARVVDLQDETGIDDRLVFLMHRVTKRREILFAGPVEFIAMIELEIRRRDRRHESLLGRHLLKRRLQPVDVGLEIGMPGIVDRTGTAHPHPRQPQRHLLAPKLSQPRDVLIDGRETPAHPGSAASRRFATGR